MSFFTLHHPFESPQTAALPQPVRDAWTQYQELDRSQWLFADEVAEQQLLHIRSLLDHCSRCVPFYARLLKEIGLVPDDIRTLEDFRRVPIISRRVWQEHSSELRATELPSDHWLTAKSTTSGTSGIPLEVLQSNVTHRWWWACNLRDLEWAGINPVGTLAGIRPPVRPFNPTELRQYQAGVTYSGWFPALNGLLQTGLCHGLDIRQEPAKQLEWLQKVSPNYLLSYPSNLDLVGKLLREQNQRLPDLRVIQTVSETLTPDMQQRIEEAFGVPVKDQYSCAEAGYVASPCPQGHGYHVHAENVLLEVLDSEDRPCAPGVTGRLVMTALHNYLNPFIRYEIQDDATVGATACPCGRGLPLLKSIEGKSRPYFQLGDGKLKMSSDILFGVYELRGYRQYQIIQRDLDRVTIQIIPDEHWTAEHPARLRQIVHRFFERPINTEIEVVDRIERTSGGKVRDLICELPPPRTAPEVSQQTATPHVPCNYRNKTVLLGWELGGGIGHVQQLLPLAKALVSHGLRVVFAIKDPDVTGAMLKSQGFEVLPAPTRRVRIDASPGKFAASYADILTSHGFGQVEELALQVEQWQRILDQVQPDLIVCDHSPTLCLASFGVIPTIVVGNGFTVPPATHATFPSLIPGQPLITSEERLLAAIQEVQTRRGRPYPQTVPGLFGKAVCLVTAIPELDPYQGERSEPLIGPLDRISGPVPRADRERYFAYLNATQPDIELVLTGLVESHVAGQVYLAASTREQRDHWRRTGLDVLESMPPIVDAIAAASIVVHHASGGTAQHALAIGRPQLLLPIHLEQLLNAQMLHQLGVGHYLYPANQSTGIAKAIRHLVSNETQKEHAWARACAMQGRGLNDALSRVLTRCFQLLTIPENTHG